MTSIHASRPTTADTAVTWNRRRYWAITGLFCAVFVGSAILTFVDPAGNEQQAAKLGYPLFIIGAPLALAKLAGVGAILWRRWPMLTLFAFAGFLYDMVLALAAHIHADDFPYGWLAVLGLILWSAAFWVERDRASRERPGEAP